VVALTTLDPRDVLRRGARTGGFAQATYGSVDRGLSQALAAAADVGMAQFLVAATHGTGRERENRGDVDTLGASRTRANPQEASGSAQLAKVVVPVAGGGRWRVGFDRYARDVDTDVRSLNPQSIRTASLAGDDAAERTRWSVERVHVGLGPLDELTWIVYRQTSGTRQDTDELRTNTTAQCLSGAGAISCRREARFTFEQREVGATAIGRRAFGQHDIVAGAEWARTTTEELRDGLQSNLTTGTSSNVVGTDVFPTRDFPRSRGERGGFFAQDSWTVAGVSVIPALRYDRFTSRAQPDAIYAAANPTRIPVALTDSAWSPKLGVVIPLGDALRITAQAATGFRAPPAFDVNVGLSNLPLGYTVIPNADLRPETSRGLELGVRGRAGMLDYALTAYRTDYRDLIVSRAPLACPADPRCVAGSPITFQSQNVTRARIEGLEARMEAFLGAGFTARAGAAASRGDDRGKGLPLNSVDPAKAVAGLAWKRADERLGGELHATHAWRKSRIDTSAGTLYATPGFTTVDLTAFAKLGSVTVDAGVFNITDRKYWLWSDVRGILNPGASIDRYTQPGRNFAVRVRVEF
jgi:hemoglobin/transferrin/lactoferrin receptor protein